MSEVRLMAEIPTYGNETMTVPVTGVQVQTVSDGFGTGVGIVTGVVFAAIVIGGAYYLFTGKSPLKRR